MSRRSALSSPTPEHISAFRDIVGPGNVLTGKDETAPYVREWRDRYHGSTAAVLRPSSTEDVRRILTLADDARLGIVPQGGNTGLVGGQIPSEMGNEIVVSLSRMKSVRTIDASSRHITIEAGATVAETRAHAETLDLIFPLSLASEGSAEIGGILSTNAGGVHVVAHGTARALALGIEVVLAGGRLVSALQPLAKDNTGYDLRNLFIGAEGTLGIITAATLKLVSRPTQTVVALAAVPNLAAVARLFERCRAQPDAPLSAFEFMCSAIVEMAVKHMPEVRNPLNTASPWMVLIELAGRATSGNVHAALAEILEGAIEAGEISDAVVAASQQHADTLWRLREGLSEAQKHEGGSIKHDISVPLDRIEAFITDAATLVERIAPGARPVPFGHFGDGNIHYNVSQPVGGDKAAFLALWETVSDAVHDLVAKMHGSISAEHGIGRMKRDALIRYKSDVEIDLMRRIKSAFDPNGIMNPGKVL